MRCQVNLVAGPIIIPSPQLLDMGPSTINALYKGAIICTPNTIFGRPTDVAHGSMPDHIFEKLQQLETLLPQSHTITIEQILKFGGKISIRAPKQSKESTTF